MAAPLIVTDASGRRQAGTARPWAWLLGLLGMLVVADLLIALARPADFEPALADDRARVQAALERATEHEHGWLLLGDSVLAGDVMQKTVPDWDEHRVLDYLRREQSSAASVGFEQVALDGMLPFDMLQIVQRLDAVDPAGDVGVVIEINPRFFSRHHARGRGCSRPFLCELGDIEGEDPRWAWSSTLWSEGQQWALDHLPVVRHRLLFPTPDPRWSERVLTSWDRGEPKFDALMGQARILEHYRGLRLNGRARQYAALEQLVARLRARNRPALLFATPLSDEIMRGTLDGEDYGAYLGRLDRLINREHQSHLRFVSLDYPGLTDAEFLDHAHLGPRGNRWLALNLLHLLGVGMSEAPARGTLAYEEGTDRSLVARISRGNQEGAPWQAMTALPAGVAVSPGGERVVIADTGNHCIRELVGPKAIMRTLAGKPGKPGHAGGRVARAEFTAPRYPVLLGDDVYVIDGPARDRLRLVSGGRVQTVTPTSGPTWTTLVRLAATADSVWLLDDGRRFLRYHPDSGVVQLRHEIDGAAAVAFDVGPDGRLYFGDDNGQVWQLSPGDDDPVLLFANNAPELLPQDEYDFFPFSFDEMALDSIGELRYVERYDSLLVQDVHEADKFGHLVTERAHLRLLSLTERKIYPWVHPLAHGGGQMFHNRHSRTLSSYFHLGSMDIDSQRGTLYYVERERSRVLELSDGLLGAAKVGHHITPITYGGLKDVFGRAAGASAMLDHHPERWAATRLEPIPRKGPYIGLFAGSSMTAVSEGAGQYSMARVFERELARRLALQDTVRFDIVQRPYRGPRMDQLVDGIDAFIGHQSPVDVIVVETHSGRMFGAYDSTDAIAADVDRIRLAAARYRSLVIVLDNDAMTSKKRDGLRGSTKRHDRFVALCEGAGFLVVRPGDALLRDAIDHAPWGTAPFTGAHGSSWAIDLTAKALAERVYPAVRDHLDGKLPALARPWTMRYAATKALRSAFAEADVGWTEAAATVPRSAMQARLDGRHLRVVVDARRASVAADASDAAIEPVALGYLMESIVRDPRGRLADTVTLSFVHFGSYDEYGVGVLEQGEITWTQTWSTEQLSAYLAALGT